MIVLSLFPGAGLLDVGFKAAGFCVVRGPDLMFGEKIEDFDGTPLKGRVDGIIGGVPCQHFSSAVLRKNKHRHENLWPEFWRVIKEVQPKWSIGENVYGAEGCATDIFQTIGLHVSYKKLVFTELGSVQARPRIIVFQGQPHHSEMFWRNLAQHGHAWGTEWRKKIGRDVARERGPKYYTITGDSLEQRNSSTGKPTRYIKGDDLLDAFDLPADFDFDPGNLYRFSRATKARLITQGVPVTAAYAIARAVKSTVYEASGKEDDNKLAASVRGGR